MTGGLWAVGGFLLIFTEPALARRIEGAGLFLLGIACVYAVMACYRREPGARPAALVLLPLLVLSDVWVGSSAGGENLVRSAVQLLAWLTLFLPNVRRYCRSLSSGCDEAACVRAADHAVAGRRPRRGHRPGRG